MRDSHSKLSLSLSLFPLSFLSLFSLPNRLGEDRGQVRCPLTSHVSNSNWLFRLYLIPLSIYHGFSLNHTLQHVSHGSHLSSYLTHFAHDTWHLLSHSQCVKCPAPPLVPRKTWNSDCLGIRRNLRWYLDFVR